MFKLLQAVAISLVLATGLAGCLTMPDGSTKPDYEMIEVASMAAMAVYVNEAKVSDDTLLGTYDRLVIMHDTLTCTVNCPPVNVLVIESSLMKALPLEYRAMGLAAIKLIRSRASMYMDINLPDEENFKIVRNVTASVVQGMVLAMQPQVLHIRG